MLGNVTVPCQERPELFSAPDPVVLWRDQEARETPKERAKRERAAIQLCWDCAVWRQCREWALSEPEQVFMVCGGLTPRQLRAARAGGGAAA